MKVSIKPGAIQSKQLARFMVDDLIEVSPELRAHANLGLVAFAIDRPFTWANGKRKKLDLAIGIPPDRLAPPVGSEIHELTTTSLSRLLIGIEEKAVMTEHGKSQPRLFSELNDAHVIVHGGGRDAIACGITVVNIAGSFVSATRQRRDQPVEITTHDQPSVATSMVRHLRGLPIRDRLDGVGFDAYCTFLLDANNQGEVSLCTAPPSPQPGDVDHYDSFLTRIAAAYRARYSDLDSLPSPTGLSVEEVLTRLSKEHPNLLIETARLAAQSNLPGSNELEAVLQSLEISANPPPTDEEG